MQFANTFFTTPDTVYEIKINDEVLFMQAGITDSSDEVKSILSPRLPMTFISQINARGGAENLATSAMCTAGKNFVYDGLKENFGKDNYTLNVIKGR